MTKKSLAIEMDENWLKRFILETIREIGGLMTNDSSPFIENGSQRRYFTGEDLIDYSSILLKDCEKIIEEPSTPKTKLQKCPFCNNHSEAKDYYGEKFYVACENENCWLCAPMSKTKQEAIEKWNSITVGEIK